MDKFATLEPIRLHSQSSSSQSRSGAPPKPAHQPKSSPLIGRLPTSLHLLILTYASIPTIPAYARSCRALLSLARSEELWNARWLNLDLDRLGLSHVLDVLEEKAHGEKAREREKQPPTLMVDDDEFGDFASGGMQAVDDEMGEFVGGSVPSTPFGAAAFAARPISVPVDTASPTGKKDASRLKYIRAHSLLVPCARVLTQPSHLILTALAALLPSQTSSSLIPRTPTSPKPPSSDSNASTLILQAQLIHVLALFLSPANQPLVTWQTLSDYLRGTSDRFQAALYASADMPAASSLT
jgi:recyclin-1